MRTARIVWALSVLAMVIGLVLLGLAAGAGADTSYDFCTDGGERGVVTLDGTCMTPTAYAAEYGDGVNVAFDPDQGFQSFEEWLITLGGVEMYEAYRAEN